MMHVWCPFLMHTFIQRHTTWIINAVQSVALEQFVAVVNLLTIPQDGMYRLSLNKPLGIWIVIYIHVCVHMGYIYIRRLSCMPAF